MYFKEFVGVLCMSLTLVRVRAEWLRNLESIIEWNGHANSSPTAVLGPIKLEPTRPWPFGFNTVVTGRQTTRRNVDIHHKIDHILALCFCKVGIASSGSLEIWKVVA